MAAPVPQAALVSSSGAYLQVYAGGQLPLPSMGRAAFICGKDLVSDTECAHGSLPNSSLRTCRSAGDERVAAIKSPATLR